jgi:hypothetical protein
MVFDMVLIRMLQTKKGTEDGFIVKQYYAGQKYIVKDSLARYFFSLGYAEKLKSKQRKS